MEKIKIMNKKENENQTGDRVAVGQHPLVRPSIFDQPPLHMDVESRNERLYDTLLNMGLFVEPVKGPSGGISKFIVSCGLPS